MDNTLMVIIIISLLILVICIFSYKDMNFSYLSNLVNKTIEKMNSEEIITDFEKIIQSENQRVFLNNLENNLENNQQNNQQNNNNNKTNEKFSSLNMNSYHNNNTELKKLNGWEIYAQAPFYEMKTMPANPVFYVKPIYRKPYNYPFGYEQSYPVDHYSPFKN